MRKNQNVHNCFRKSPSARIRSVIAVDHWSNDKNSCWKGESHIWTFYLAFMQQNICGSWWDKVLIDVLMGTVCLVPLKIEAHLIGSEPVVISSSLFPRPTQENTRHTYPWNREKVLFITETGRLSTSYHYNSWLRGELILFYSWICMEWTQRWK